MAVELVARVEEARAKCQDVCDRSQARLERLREETDAKIEALLDQAAETQTDKAKVQQRITENLRRLRSARGAAAAGPGADGGRPRGVKPRGLGA